MDAGVPEEGLDRGEGGGVHELEVALVVLRTALATLSLVDQVLHTVHVKGDRVGAGIVPGETHVANSTRRCHQIQKQRPF